MSFIKLNVLCDRFFYYSWIVAARKILGGVKTACRLTDSFFFLLFSKSDNNHIMHRRKFLGRVVDFDRRAKSNNVSSITALVDTVQPFPNRGFVQKSLCY